MVAGERRRFELCELELRVPKDSQSLLGFIHPSVGLSLSVLDPADPGLERLGRARQLSIKCVVG